MRGHAAGAAQRPGQRTGIIEPGPADRRPGIAAVLGHLRLGLAARLLLAFAALVIPLLLFSVWSFQRSLAERRDAALTDTVESAQTAAALVFGLLRDLDTTSAVMGLAFGQQVRPLDQATAGPTLTALAERYSTIRAVFLTDPAGRVIAAQRGEGIGVDVGGRPYTQALLSGQEFVLTDATTGIQSGEPTVTLARTVRTPDGALRAFLMIAFYPGQLADLFPGALPADASLTVLDRRGQIIYSSTSPNLPANERDLGGSPLVQAALAGAVATTSGTTGLDGQERLGALAPVRDYGWVAIYSRTTAAVAGPLERLYRRQLIGLGAVTLLAFVAALLLSRRLTGRLTRLAAHARAVGHGETTTRAPLEGPVEVQELATALNAMAAEIQDRFAEREAAAAAVREAEARYRGIFEHALEGIFQTGFDGRFRAVNPAGARLLGYDSPEALMAEVDDVRVLYADPERLADYQREMRARGQVTNFEFELRQRDGSTRWVSLNARAMRRPDGRVDTVEGMVSDITDRKAAAETGLRLAAIVDSSEDAIIGKTLDGVITNWNAAAERMYGYPAAEAVGRSIAMLVPPDRPDELPGIMARLRRGEAIEQYETERVRRDGSRLAVALTISPIREPDGHIIGASTIARDITERKQAERERARLLRAEQAARAEAEAANQAKDDFLSVLSHELRTPLTSILGFTSLLRRRFAGGDGTLARGLETIERSARTQARLVGDLLDISRILAGKLELEVAPTELVPVIEAAVEGVRPAAEEKGLALTTELEPEVGEVPGDAVRLQQVLTNLLANAVKFTPERGRVTVRLDEEGGEARITVGDTGVGIAPEFLPHVFERFRQADGSSTRAYGGLGLGLSIVRDLVALHGGHVSAESAGPGRGASFTVCLPLAAAPSPEQAVARPAGQDGARSATGALAGTSVLVVDDDTDTRAFLEQLLTGEGATVTTASSGAEGRAAFARARPAVLVVDIGMPEEDGHAFIRQVRRLPEAAGGRTPALALTAYASLEDRRQALAAGFNAHLAKPVDPPALIASLLDLARPHQRA